jgi:hypothetical protein
MKMIKILLLSIVLMPLVGGEVKVTKVTEGETLGRDGVPKQTTSSVIRFDEKEKFCRFDSWRSTDRRGVFVTAGGCQVVVTVGVLRGETQELFIISPKIKLPVLVGGVTAKSLSKYEDDIKRFLVSEGVYLVEISNEGDPKILSKKDLDAKIDFLVEWFEENQMYL